MFYRSIRGTRYRVSLLPSLSPSLHYFLLDVDYILDDDLPRHLRYATRADGGAAETPRAPRTVKLKKSVFLTKSLPM